MALTLCTCTLNVKNALSGAYSTAELVWELRKSMVDSGTGLYLSKPIRATAVAGVCTLVLTETTTDSQLGVFTLNWNDGDNYGSITFDPVKIPNQSTLDLSTLLTVARG
jgi:hypothetical protein